MEEKFCKFCGAKIPADAIVCSSCGRQVKSNAPFGSRGQKNKYTSFLLCLFFGGLGIHRFYEGKIGEGIVCIICTILFAVIIPSWSRWWAGYFPCLIVGWLIRANGIVAELTLYVCKPKLCVAAE